MVRRRPEDIDREVRQEYLSRLQRLLKTTTDRSRRDDLQAIFEKARGQRGQPKVWCGDF